MTALPYYLRLQSALRELSPDFSLPAEDCLPDSIDEFSMSGCLDAPDCIPAGSTVARGDYRTVLSRNIHRVCAFEFKFFDQSVSLEDCNFLSAVEPASDSSKVTYYVEVKKCSRRESSYTWPGRVWIRGYTRNGKRVYSEHFAYVSLRHRGPRSTTYQTLELARSRCRELNEHEWSMQIDLPWLNSKIDEAELWLSDNYAGGVQ